MKRAFSGFIFTILALIFLIAPFLILAYVKKEIYFVDKNGTYLSVGAIFGLGYILALSKGAFNELNKQLSKLLNMCIILVIIWFFNSIIFDAFNIVLCGIIGYSLFSIFNALGKKQFRLMNEYSHEKERMKARAKIGRDFEINGRG